MTLFWVFTMSKTTPFMLSLSITYLFPERVKKDTIGSYNKLEY